MPIKKSKKKNNRKGGDHVKGPLANVARNGGELSMDPEKAKKVKLRNKTVTGRNTGGDEKPAPVNNPPKNRAGKSNSVVNRARSRKQTYGDK
jgi:hypothetical protein